MGIPILAEYDRQVTPLNWLKKRPFGLFFLSPIRILILFIRRLISFVEEVDNLIHNHGNRYKEIHYSIRSHAPTLSISDWTLAMTLLAKRWRSITIRGAVDFRASVTAL